MRVVAIELTREARNAAYRAGICIGCSDPSRIGCTEPHSPGRTRCEECHRIWSITPPLGAIPAGALYDLDVLCTGPTCVRDGKRFPVRRAGVPGAGLCEFCYGASRRP